MHRSALRLSLILGLAAGSITAATPAPKKAPKPTEAEKRLSYALGQEAALRQKKLGIALDLPSFLKGLQDLQKNKPGLLTKDEAAKVLEDFEAEWAKGAEERNRKEGAAFLEANGKKSGIKTTASGLQYQVLTEGTGAAPTAEDSVKVHYRGTLLDGTEFDSSYKRNEPASFPLKRVIKGWTEGLQLLKVGGKARLYIPFDLAYGPKGRGAIPPAATLVFEVELLGIQTAK